MILTPTRVALYKGNLPILSVIGHATNIKIGMIGISKIRQLLVSISMSVVAVTVTVGPITIVRCETRSIQTYSLGLEGFHVVSEAEHLNGFHIG